MSPLRAPAVSCSSPSSRASTVVCMFSRGRVVREIWTRSARGRVVRRVANVRKSQSMHDRQNAATHVVGLRKIFEGVFKEGLS